MSKDILNEISVTEFSISDAGKTIFGKLYKPVSGNSFPAVILGHGYNGCHTDWDRECTFYAQNGYVAYAYDFCGGSMRSKSSGKTTEMTIFSERDDVKTVFNAISALEFVDSNNVFVMGGSQGGLVSSLAVDELLGKVRGMILYFPAFCIADDWQKKYSDMNLVPDVIDFWDMKLGKVFVTSLQDYDTYKHIGTYAGPVLIIHGDRDPIVRLRYAESADALYQNCTLHVLAGEGHGFSPSGAETAMNDVLSFMNENRV